MCVLYFEVLNQLDRFYTTLSKGTHIRGLATYQAQHGLVDMHGMRYSLLHNMFLCSALLNLIVFLINISNITFLFLVKKLFLLCTKGLVGFLYMLGSFVAGLLACCMSILCTNLKQEKSFFSMCTLMLLCSNVSAQVLRTVPD